MDAELHPENVREVLSSYIQANLLTLGRCDVFDFKAEAGKRALGGC